MRRGLEDAFGLLSAPASVGAAGRAYLLLDVFAERPLEGNQLAVFADGAGLEDHEMQAIARELRLSETVFLLAPQRTGDARVRIFTPAVELPFAGHPVLGTGAALAAARGLEEIVLETGAGAIAVELSSREGPVLTASMRQPIPTWEPVGEPEPLLAALGLASSRLPVERYCNGPRHVFVAAGSPQEVAELDPDLRAIQELEPDSGVSCFAGGNGRFKTRMFAPGLGVPEDPRPGPPRDRWPCIWCATAGPVPASAWRSVRARSWDDRRCWSVKPRAKRTASSGSRCREG